MDDGVWINETFQTSSCYPIIGVFAVTKTLVVQILHFLNYIKSETKMKRTKEKKTERIYHLHVKRVMFSSKKNVQANRMKTRWQL